MTEVHPNLFTGSDQDVSILTGYSRWSILHAAKEPWHRRAVGYATPGAPKEHPDYLFARMSHSEMALNLVDAKDPRFILPAVVNAGISFLADRLAAGDRVLCHCNQGQSRGPGIAFLYLLGAGILPRDRDAAFQHFGKLYSGFSPSEGVRGYIEGCF